MPSKGVLLACATCAMVLCAPPVRGDQRLTGATNVAVGTISGTHDTTIDFSLTNGSHEPYSFAVGWNLTKSECAEYSLDPTLRYRMSSVLNRDQSLAFAIDLCPNESWERDPVGCIRIEPNLRLDGLNPIVHLLGPGSMLPIGRGQQVLVWRSADPSVVMPRSLHSKPFDVAGNACHPKP